MSRFLSPSIPVFTPISRTIPKPVFLQYHPRRWVSVKFISRTSEGNSFRISYLIDTCGFPPERAALVSKRMNFETRENPDLVIEFFKEHGFSHTQVLNVIGTVPEFLVSDPQKSFVPKIEFFKSKGFSDSDIANIINGCPNILRRSLQNEIIPCFDFFDNMFLSKDRFMKAIKRCSGILYDLDDTSEPNITLLRERGVPESHIIRLIEYFPGSLKVAPKRFKEIVEEVKELGFNPSKLHFVIAIHAKNSISKSSWARKEGIYRRWGWTDNDIHAAFVTYPSCMVVSDGKIEAVMDFLVNRLGFKSSAIVRYPIVLTMSLEKRIIPRGSVTLVLLSKGLVKELKLRAIFGGVERVFLDKFIFCHEKEGGELLNLYRTKLALAG